MNFASHRNSSEFTFTCQRHVGENRMNQPLTTTDEKIEVQLSYCLYRSTATLGIDEHELDQILEKSRVRNQLRGLSGCLHYENGVFFNGLKGLHRHFIHYLASSRTIADI